jgi:hypothetical protein
MEALELDQGQWPGKGRWLLRAFLVPYQHLIGDLSKQVNWPGSLWGWEMQSAGAGTLFFKPEGYWHRPYKQRRIAMRSKPWDPIQEAVPYSDGLLVRFRPQVCVLGRLQT